MSRVERQAAPLRLQVLKLLREDIFAGHRAPGDRLREGDLCATYDVSRTVVREVLRQLESEHLVTVVAGHGPIVTVLSTREIESLYEVRAALEALAGELFARRASDEQAAGLLAHLESMDETYLRGTLVTRERSKSRFYELLLAGADNEVLTTDLAGLHTRIALFRRYAFVDDERVARSHEELRRIVRACAQDRDPVAARAACEHHIRLAGRLAVLEHERRTQDGTAPGRPESAA